jgi:site-specific recombinase XerD
LDYLAKLFEDGYAFRSINVHRSAISAYHAKIDGVKAGEHPLVKNLMSGVHNKRAPLPRYCVIWDVEKVLDLFRKKPDSSLTLKELTHRAAMLLALASVSRVSEIQLLDLNYLASSENTLKFFFKEAPKNFKKAGCVPQPVVIHASGMDICPVKTVSRYIEKTAPLRQKNHTQLFISTILPHKPVTRPTIANWLKEVLRQTGIDTEVFRGHSTRSASSSKAVTRGATVTDILNAGGWSSESTWQCFYNKNISDSNFRFQRSIFNNN